MKKIEYCIVILILLSTIFSIESAVLEEQEYVRKAIGFTNQNQPVTQQEIDDLLLGHEILCGISGTNDESIRRQARDSINLAINHGSDETIKVLKNAWKDEFCKIAESSVRTKILNTIRLAIEKKEPLNTLKIFIKISCGLASITDLTIFEEAIESVSEAVEKNKPRKLITALENAWKYHFLHIDDPAIRKEAEENIKHAETPEKIRGVSISWEYYLAHITDSSIRARFARELIEASNLEKFEEINRANITEIFELSLVTDDNKRQTLIKKLRESNSVLDQELGTQLKKRFYPVKLSHETIQALNKFNFANINKHMPEPLADLSDEPIDIVGFVEEFFNKIMVNKTNLESPYRLEARAIDDTESSLNSIRLRSLGFFKTLVGIPLKESETSGWQMYEDNKQDMINSIKHIIKSLQNKFRSTDNDDIKDAVIGFSIVLKGILYCPTGQAEGIESAVNAFVRGKNTTSTDPVELFGKYIMTPSVVKAFYNAFNRKGEGVHAIARAKTVLREHIKIPQAIASFKERISKVPDEEIPEIFNKFFRNFTDKFIIQEARRNIQTADDFAVISDLKQKERAKIIKMERPISISSIVEWIYNHKLPEEKIEDALTICGIGDDYTSISDAGIIEVLTRMGFANR